MTTRGNSMPSSLAESGVPLPLPNELCSVDHDQRNGPGEDFGLYV